MTTLLAFYMEGTTPGTDQWVICTSFVSIIFLLLTPLNNSYRQHVLLGTIDLSDLEIYSKISDELETSTKDRVADAQVEVEPEIEKIVSELASAIDSFLQGHYEASIIHSYNVREGLDRVVYEWVKTDSKTIFLKAEKDSLDEWRQKIAHSNVRTPSHISKKTRSGQEKDENLYFKDVKTDYQKALKSIEFVMKIIRYMTGNQV
jgi:hypothetical protein